MGPKITPLPLPVTKGTLFADSLPYRLWSVVLEILGVNSGCAQEVTEISCLRVPADTLTRPPFRFQVLSMPFVETTIGPQLLGFPVLETQAHDGKAGSLCPLLLCLFLWTFQGLK